MLYKQIYTGVDVLFFLDISSLTGLTHILTDALIIIYL